MVEIAARAAALDKAAGVAETGIEIGAAVVEAVVQSTNARPRHKRGL